MLVMFAFSLVFLAGCGGSGGHSAIAPDQTRTAADVGTVATVCEEDCNFDSVDAAIKFGTADVIQIMAGVYEGLFGDEIIVDREVTLEGPQAGLSACDREDQDAEAIIAAILVVAADNVTIDGLFVAAILIDGADGTLIQNTIVDEEIADEGTNTERICNFLAGDGICENCEAPAPELCLTAKLEQLDILNGISLSDSSDASHLKNAIKGLQASVDAKLWTDECALSEESKGKGKGWGMGFGSVEGMKVFKNERKAVHFLKKIKNPTPEILAAGETLTAVDQLLAQKAIDENPACFPDKVSYIMDKADHLLATDKFVPGISFYGLAWQIAATKCD